ncbi:MAG: pyrroline-5-carboxylate reductase [Rhodospirillaceae bacterium]
MSVSPSDMAQPPRSLSGAGPDGRPPQVLLIGAGKMGGAMARGWLARGLPPENLAVVDPSLPALQNGVTSFPSADALFLCLGSSVPDVVVVAIKPQLFASLLPAYAPLAKAGALFFSVAAGQTLSGMQDLLGGSARLVRAMPNTPASVGWGMTVMVAGDGVQLQDRTLCSALANAIGDTAWVEDEALMDAVTAISGSGPAYVFQLTESLTQGAEALGLPKDLAALLARRTVIGAGVLMDRDPSPASTLRENVTSPGGTTAAALEVLRAEPVGMTDLVTKAVTAARDRSQALAKP